MGLCAAHEDLNNHDDLRHDLLMQAIAGKTQALASAPTLCRMEARSQTRSMFELQKLLVELFIQKHKTPPKELTLDFDATDDPLMATKKVASFMAATRVTASYLSMYFAGTILS